MARDTRLIGRFFDVGGAVHNVKHPTYGAAGNGSSDDTDAIVAATEAAEGQPVYFPPGTYVFGDSTEDLDVDVHWQGAGREETTLIYSGPGGQERVWELQRNARLADLTIDGDDLLRKAVLFNPRADDVVEVERCTFKNLFHETGSSSSAQGIWIAGRCRRFTVRDCIFQDIDSDLPAGSPRPTTRGINFSTTAQHAGQTGGAPEIAIVEGCVFDGILAGGEWGEQDIDADAIAWRNDEDGESALYVRDCLFTRCAKRAIKANNADNLYVDSCTFRDSGDAVARNTITIQRGTGHVRGCMFDYATGANVPRAVINASFDSANVLIEGNTIRVRNDDALASNQIPFRLSGDSAINIMIIDNKIIVPGGVQHVVGARMEAQDTAPEAEEVGVQNCVVEGNIISDLDTEFYSIERAGSGHTFQAFRARSNQILNGSDDQLSVDETTTNLTVEFPGVVFDDIGDVATLDDGYLRFVEEAGAVRVNREQITDGRIHTRIQSAAVGGSATAIADLTNAGFVIVSGERTDASGGGNRVFVDLVLMTVSGEEVVVASAERNTPAGRTYSQSGGNLELAMAADTYRVITRGWSLDALPS
ncbi:MAG: glycosyl hydrolase family 28-related protein [Gemmatimonadota bacterium]